MPHVAVYQFHSLGHALLLSSSSGVALGASVLASCWSSLSLLGGPTQPSVHPCFVFTPPVLDLAAEAAVAGRFCSRRETLTPIMEFALERLLRIRSSSGDDNVSPELERTIGCLQTLNQAERELREAAAALGPPPPAGWGFGGSPTHPLLIKASC